MNNKALKINPIDSDVLNDKGLVLANLRKYEEALKLYDKALEIEVILFNKNLVIAKMKQESSDLSLIRPIVI